MITRTSGFTPKQLLRAIRYAAGGVRVKLLLEFLRYNSRELPVSAALECEFENLANYQSDYAALADLLGRPSQSPPFNETDFLYRMLTRPHSAGAIGLNDYLFLTAFTSILAPFHVVEVGTLTGFSAAIIAAALHRKHGSAKSFQVDTIDTQLQCLTDQAQRTGFEINELIPEIASSVCVHAPHDSRIVSQLVARDELDLAFIDADHQHPRPLLDLIRLAPYVRGGGWVILHDIQLGSASEAVPKEERSQWAAPAGAEWLFSRWPFSKISGGNIGAIQLPKDKSQLVPFALRLLEMPSELEGESGRRTRLEVLYSLSALFEDT